MKISDDFAQYLTEQARSPSAAIHEFRLLHSTEGNFIHVFLEGDEDALYYLTDVRQRLRGRNLCQYLCGGKWGVIEVREFIRSQGYAEAFCLYFIDRDYDDLFGKQPSADSFTYLSDDYSIENSIVSLEAIEVILVDLAGLSKADVIYKKIVDRFPTAHSSFAAKIDPILAWSLASREAGGKPNYNNVNLKNVFDGNRTALFRALTRDLITFEKP